MTHLDDIHLIHVLVSLFSVESIIKFIQINKKCNEIRRFITFPQLLVCSSQNSCSSDSSEDDGCEPSISMDKLFEIFPNTTTISMKGDDLLQFDWEGNDNIHFEKEIEHIEEICLNDFPSNPDILQDINDKIVEIDTTLCYYDTYDFSLYKNLHVCKLDFNYATFNITELFPSTSQHLDLLRISNPSNPKDLFALRSYINFERIIIDTTTSITKEEFEVFSTFAIVTAHQIEDEEDTDIEFEEDIDIITESQEETCYVTSQPTKA
ncbi:Uncharacterized protein QTN25_007380 [Entamoeba marina]